MATSATVPVNGQPSKIPFVVSCSAPAAAPIAKKGITQRPPSIFEKIIFKPVLDYFDRPWRPAHEDLPVRLSPEHFGNSSLPFAREATSSEESRLRDLRLACVKTGETRFPISLWSSLYMYSVPIPALPDYFENFKILHLSDLHFEESHRRSVHELNALTTWMTGHGISVDVVVISGDIITRRRSDLTGEAIEALTKLRQLARCAFFVFGNHDYHGFSEDELARELERIDFVNLTHARSTICSHGAELNLFGIDDAIFGRPQPPQAVDSEALNIGLTHNLDAFRSNFPNSFDLVLSGHTHWGELRFFDGVKLMAMRGYADSVNVQMRHWAMLTDRALSFVHPGLARHYVSMERWGLRFLRHAPGFVIHTLKSYRGA